MGINVDAQAKALEAVKGGMEVKEAAQKFGVNVEELQNALSGKGDEPPQKEMFTQGDFVFEFTDGKFTGVADMSVSNQPKKISLADYYKANPWLEGYTPTLDGGKVKFVAANGTEYNDSASVKMAKLAYNGLKEAGKAKVNKLVESGKAAIKDIQAEPNYFAKVKVAFDAINNAMKGEVEDGVQQSQMSPAYIVGIAAVMLVAFASCTAEFNNEATVTVNIPSNGTIEQALKEILKAIENGQQQQLQLYYPTIKAILENQIALGKSFDELIALVQSIGKDTSNISQMTSELIDSLVENNSLLLGIKGDLETSNKNQEAILKAIYEVKASVDNVKALLENLPANLKAEFQSDLTAILNAIEKGNVSLNVINNSVRNLAQNMMAKFDELTKEVKFNGKTQTEIKALLEKILNANTDNVQALQDILAVLRSIDVTTKDIKATLADLKKEIEDKFKQDTRFQQDMRAAFAKMQGTEEQQAELLKQILAAIDKLGAANKQYYLGIINQMTQQGAKMDDVIALLKAINKSVDEGNQQNKAMGEAILAAIAKLGSGVASKLTAILNAIPKDSADMTEVIKLLNAMNTKLDETKAQDKKYYEAILNAISKLGTSYSAQLTAILEAIKSGKVNLDTADIVKWLETINNNVVEGNKQDKIYGDKMIANLEKLINLVKAGNATLENIEKMVNNTNTIVAHIDGDLHEMKAKFADFTNKIIARIDKYGDNAMNLGNAILEAIINKKCGGGSGSSTDLSGVIAKMDKILAKLDEILKAIKDHKVEVKVDVTGKVTCTCNCGQCGGKSPNEGIIEDLKDLNELLG